MLKFLLPLAAAIVLFAAGPSLATETEEPDPQASWNLTDLYPSVEAWSEARDEVMGTLTE